MIAADLLDWGVQVIVWLQQWGTGLIVPMRALSFTGDIEFYLLLLPILYWTVDRRLGARVATFLLLSIMLNNVLKMLLHNPRPYWYTTQVQLWTDPEFSFGIPSGHAQNAVVMWSLFALYGQRAWGWLAALALISLTGLSRVYLGVHFPTDVMAGWLLGLLFLGCGLLAEGAILRWFKRYPPFRQVSILLLLSLALLASGLGARALVQATWSMPPVWIQNAIAATSILPEPFSLHDIVTVTGALWGLGAGVVLCTRWGGFVPRTTWKERVLRVVIGVIGVLLLWRGLDLLFTPIAADESALGYCLRYLRYMAIGLWVGAFAPLLFVRLGLAKPLTLPTAKMA